MRYSRQSIFKKLGEKGQRKLSRSKVVIVGMGALGGTAAQLLARAGVGELVLVDGDKAELVNLHRQLLFTEKDIGKNKAAAAADYLKTVNSDIKIKGIAENITRKNFKLLKSNLVLDCTDNLEARFVINEFCVKNKIPWIHAAAIRAEGQLVVFRPGAACFECVFGADKKGQKCITEGVINTVPAITAALQATEAIKLLIGEKTERDLLRIDAWNNSITRIKVKKKQGCRLKCTKQ